MVKTILTISSNTFYPYFNLALEKYLFDTVDDDTVILYLWQNQNTVVYGYNQNAWKEVHITKLLDNGGFPARRLSGGGAVYHDHGNLNFTFIAKENSYNLDKQLQVIINACSALGMDAQKTGRNDLTIDGFKFSGNAFYKSNGRNYHHGTILLDVDKNKMAEYLNVDRSKLESKGIRSVKSRVKNLKDFCPDITVDIMREKLFDAFSQVYNLDITPISAEDLDFNTIKSYEKIFSSDEWLFGRKINFSNRIQNRFAWGDFDLNVNVTKGIISEAILYSDANDEHFIASISPLLKNTAYTFDSISKIIKECCQNDEHLEMYKDICELLFKSI